MCKKKYCIKNHIFWIMGDAGGTDFIAEISKGMKYPYIYIYILL